MLPVRLGNNRNIYSLEKLPAAAAAPSLFQPVLPISVANRDGAGKGWSLVQSLLVSRIFSEYQAEQRPDLSCLLRDIISAARGTQQEMGQQHQNLLCDEPGVLGGSRAAGAVLGLGATLTFLAGATTAQLPAFFHKDIIQQSL